ncbi:hypothetical protein DPMN_061801 [Dreissena polymorpha]|uniref:Uncharacterized protein n=1 Tax=Dreissena polymorpha TaxID=45954 RepID=A0A9D4C7P0_DREPO|nr:hypothetical protein DPMN_061801 [Dreissena polymorpha]
MYVQLGITGRADLLWQALYTGFQQCYERSHAVLEVDMEMNQVIQSFMEDIDVDRTNSCVDGQALMTCCLTLPLSKAK